MGSEAATRVLSDDQTECFQGGDTGSNPVGDANKNKVLRRHPLFLSKICPIYALERLWTAAEESERAALRLDILETTIEAVGIPPPSIR